MSTFRRLAGLLRPNWGRAVAATLAMGLIASATTVYAWAAGPLLAAFFSGGEVPGWPAVAAPPLGLGVIALAIGATAVVHGAASYAQQVLLARIGLDAVLALRVRLYHHMLRLPMGTLQEQRRGELGTRVAQEVLRVQGLLVLGIAGLTRHAVSAIALGAFALSRDVLLGTIGILGIPIIGLGVWALSRQTRRAYRDTWEAETQLSGRATETAQLVPLVRAYGGETHAEASFAGHAHHAHALAYDALRLRARVGPAIEIGAAAALVGTLAIAAGRLDAGHLDPAAAVSFFAAMILLYRPVQSLGGLLANLVGGLAALDRIEEFLAIEPEKTGPANTECPPMERSLELRDVHFSYGDKKVLRGVDLRLNKGESLAIVGSSGEGKTTLLLILLGLLRPDRGTVLMDGRDLAQACGTERRRHFAWVGQEPLLFSTTVLDNIALGDPAPDRERAKKAAEAAGAAAFIETLEGEYDAPLAEGGANLSVGERQRLCVARALYRRPGVLVLDEPTAALDGTAEAALSQTLHDILQQDQTVVLASHRERTVQRVDRVAVLHGGTIVDSGSPRELGERTGLFRSLFGGISP